MYAAAFSPCVRMRRMPRPSSATSESYRLVGTRKMSRTPKAIHAFAMYSKPLIKRPLPCWYLAQWDMVYLHALAMVWQTQPTVELSGEVPEHLRQSAFVVGNGER